MRPSTRGAVWAWDITHVAYGGVQADVVVVAPGAGRRLFVHKVILTKALLAADAKVMLGGIVLDVKIAADTGTAMLELPFEAPAAGAVDVPLTLTSDGGLTITVYSIEGPVV